jgi:superfamily I DNA and/or RNA helicase
MPEAARRQKEREIKIELLKEADVYDHFLLFSLIFQLLFRCVSTLNYVGNSIFDSFSPYEINNQSNKTKKPPSTIPTLFNCLIIDEASQCIEIDNYIPLRLGINRIVLVGDPEQLYSSIFFLFDIIE